MERSEHYRSRLADGSVAEPFGKVGAEVSEEEAYEAARLTALAMLASLKRALGDHTRSAGLPVEIEAEVEIRSGEDFTPR